MPALLAEIPSLASVFVPIVVGGATTLFFAWLLLANQSSLSIYVRDGFFKLWAALQRKSITVQDTNDLSPADIRSVLRSRNKGSFFERAVSQKAWLPLHSLESEDGERYERMRIVFHKVLVETRYPKRIAGLMEKHCNRDMSSCRSVCETVARVFFDLLFDKELDDESAKLYFDASMEWRREIAMKGFASKTTKVAFVKHLARHIPNKWFETYPECTKMEIVSCFAQPFFISPMINVSDILVAVFNVAATLPQNARSPVQLNAKELVKMAMLKYPAFPILEREVSPNQQVILLLSPTSNEKQASALLFGSGPRRCPGKDVALTLLHHIVERASRNMWKNFTPAVGHLYSGRNNDKEVVVSELLFVLRVLVRTLGMAALDFIGLKYADSASQAFYSEDQDMVEERSVPAVSVDLVGNDTDSGAESASDSECEY